MAARASLYAATMESDDATDTTQTTTGHVQKRY